MSTPPKFKPSEIVAALHASKGMVYVAARQLDCSANTIYNYAKRHPQVQAAMTHSAVQIQQWSLASS